MERKISLKKNLIGKDEVIHTNSCKYREYKVDDKGKIYGEKYMKGTNIYKRLDLLNDISRYGEKLFKLYKNNFLWENEFEIEWGNPIEYLPIKDFEKNTEMTNKYLIELFSKYGILGNVKEEENVDYPCSYITTKDIRKLVNQLIVIYIVNTIKNGIVSLYNMQNDDEIPQVSENAIKLVELITNNEVKLNLINANIKEILQYIQKAKKTLVAFNNKYSVLFDKATYKYIQLDIKADEINYNICSEDLLQLAWETFVDISSVPNTNKNICVCKKCGQIEEKTGKNQKFCSSCREERNWNTETDENKKKLISEISNYYNINKNIDMELKTIIEKIMQYKSRERHDISVRKLQEILRQVKIQNN